MTASLIASVAGSAQAAGQAESLIQGTYPRLQDGAPQSLSQYQGKVLLVVNTASKCGYTNQYDGLERIYDKYKDRGLVVLGFPSNDFGGQEPGTNGQIADFCRLTYGVQFPMVAKTDVVGASVNPFYQRLAQATGKKPEWNFHKYLIDRSGTRVQSFSSGTAPESRTLIAAIEKLLAE